MRNFLPHLLMFPWLSRWRATNPTWAPLTRHSTCDYMWLLGLCQGQLQTFTSVIASTWRGRDLSRKPARKENVHLTSRFISHLQMIPVQRTGPTCRISGNVMAKSNARFPPTPLHWNVASPRPYPANTCRWSSSVFQVFKLRPLNNTEKHKKDFCKKSM